MQLYQEPRKGERQRRRDRETEKEQKQVGTFAVPHKGLSRISSRLFDAFGAKRTPMLTPSSHSVPETAHVEDSVSSSSSCIQSHASNHLGFANNFIRLNPRARPLLRPAASTSLLTLTGFGT